VRIGILGGTFDPIHNGHLAAAQSVAKTFQTDEIHFVPAYRAPHKQPEGVTSAFHRFAMVALATIPIAQFRHPPMKWIRWQSAIPSKPWSRRSRPSWRLIDFRAGHGHVSEIETWRYRRLFELAHFAIVHRPGFELREDCCITNLMRAINRIAELARRLPAVRATPIHRQEFATIAGKERGPSSASGTSLELY
jgi:nicotinate-nucleotide adenylyltransferase